MTTFDQGYLKTVLGNAVNHITAAVKTIDEAPAPDQVDLNRLDLYLSDALGTMHTATEHVETTRPEGPRAPRPPVAPAPDDHHDDPTFGALRSEATRDDKKPAAPSEPSWLQRHLLALTMLALAALAAGGAWWWYSLAH